MKSSDRWAVFISGRGSNLAAAIDQMGDQIGVVVSSNPLAAGVLRAKRAGIEVLELSKPILWMHLTKDLRERQINKIFLLGFMKIIPIEFINDWFDQIINVHPSLLPKYAGLQSIERAFKDKADIGVSVHKVIPEVDAGEILLQKTSVSSLAFESGDLSLQEVELRVHQDEQVLVRKIIERY